MNNQEMINRFFQQIDEPTFISAVASQFIKDGVDVVNDLLQDGEFVTDVPDENDIRIQAAILFEAKIDELFESVKQEIEKRQLKRTIQIAIDEV